MMMISPFSNASNLSKLSSNNAGRFNPTPTAAALPPAQDTLRFSGDLFEHYLNANAQSLDSRTLPAFLKEKPEQEKMDAGFKAICNTVVLRDGDKEFNVAEVLAFLCRKNPEDGYSGSARIERLKGYFPNLDVNALEQAFNQLHKHPNCYLGKQDESGFPIMYWLRRSGENMIERLYPEVAMPPLNVRHIDQNRR
jgi:hypothetical protein